MLSFVENHLPELLNVMVVAPWPFVVLILGWKYQPTMAEWIKMRASKPTVNMEDLIEQIIKKLDSRYVQINSCHTHIDEFKKNMDSDISNLSKVMQQNMSGLREEININMSNVSKMLELLLDKFMEHLNK